MNEVPVEKVPAKMNKVKRWLVLLAICYVAILGGLMLLETKAVYPAPRGGSAVAAEHGAEDVAFQSKDGTRLHGWYFDHGAATTSTIVFFHGNAESIERSGPWIGNFARSLNANVFIFDYRGYGKSEGQPFEKGVVQDGLAAIDWLCERTGKSSDKFFYLGRSLGGGVCVQVAKEKQPKGLILVSTFSSMVDVAAGMYWFLPVRLVMRNRYESAAAIANIDVPLLQIHGDQDRMIPFKLGQRLHAAVPSVNKKMLTDEGSGHNDVMIEKFYEELTRFLRQ